MKKRVKTVMRVEAMCIGAPFILSNTKTLRDIYRELPEWAFFHNHPNSLSSSLINVKDKYEVLRDAVKVSRRRLLREAEEQLRELRLWIEGG